MSEVSQLVRKHLLGLKPYSSARDEYQGTTGIFLDANENSFGSVGLGNANRYPDPYQQKLKARIAKIKGIDARYIYLGNGSDEPIDLLIRVFCEPQKDKIAYFVPTYGMYKVSADIHNVKQIEIPLTDDFDIDLSTVEAIDKRDLKITFICSPNNPTGNLLKRSSIEFLLNSLPGIVVIDEAYIDFSDAGGYLKDLEKYPRLVILQTLSKAWGLAAYRLGMAFAAPEILGFLNKIKPPYNISGPVQHMVFEALEKEPNVLEWIKVISKEKKQLSKQITALPNVLKVYPSETNFLLVKFKESQPVFRFLTDKQIVVRDRSNNPGCDNCLRITVGTQEENRRLMNALSEYLK